MGLRINELIALADQLARQAPASVLTISRLDVFVGLQDIVVVFERAGLKLPVDFVENRAGKRIFLDQILLDLGIKKVDSVDFSNFEGATLTLDLGAPLDPPMELYDLVYESGTLEHIFNFPVAIRNVMGFCAEGGCVFLNTVCNNFSGHGFYQFSPELFYSIVRCSAGYVMQDVHAYEDFDHSRRYSVENPQVIGKRVEIRSFLPVNMAIRMVRQRVVVGGAAVEPVMQSDYMEAWKAGSVYSNSYVGYSLRGGNSIFRRIVLALGLVAPSLMRFFIAKRRRAMYIGEKRSDLICR